MREASKRIAQMQGFLITIDLTGEFVTRLGAVVQVYKRIQFIECFVTCWLFGLLFFSFDQFMEYYHLLLLFVHTNFSSEAASTAKG